MTVDPEGGRKPRRRPDPPREKFEGDTSTITHKPRVVRNPDVIRRQRLLRAYGFGVVVDGIWGPASQAAWRRYQSRIHPQTPVSPRPSSGVDLAAERREQAQIRKRQTEFARRAAARARVFARGVAQRREVLTSAANDRAEKAMHLEQIRRELAAHRGERPTAPGVITRLERIRSQFHNEQIAQREVAAETRRQISFAKQARAKAPESWNIRELLAVTTDPITGTLDPRKPDEVRRVQRWLRANGHPELSLDGTWGKQTHDALLSVFRQEQQKQQTSRRRELVRTFFEPKVVKPGEMIAGYTVAGPGELEELLRGGGVQAAFVWQQLVKRLARPEVSWTAFQEEQLSRLERDVRPAINGVRPFEPAKFIPRSVESRILDLQFRALQWFGAGGSLDTGMAFGHRDVSTALKHLSALQSSRTAADLQRRLQGIGALVEREEKARLALAAQNRSWWDREWDHIKTGLFWMGKPADYVAGEVQTGFLLMTNALANGGRGRGSVISHEQGLALQKQWEKEHPWMDLTLEVIFDPLWLVNPVKIVQGAGRATMAGALSLEQLGLNVGDAGKIARFGSAIATKPAETLRGVSLIGSGLRHPLRTDLGRLGETLQIDHAQSVARKLGQSKREMAASVKNRVRVMRRTGFQLDTALWGSRTPALGEIQYAIDAAEPHVRAALTDLAGSIVPTLHKGRASLFTHVSRDSPDTVIGGQIRGYVTRAVEHLALQNVALDEGHVAFVVAKYGDEWLGELLRKHRISGQVFEGIRSGRISNPSETALLKYRAVLDEYGREIVPVASDEAATQAGRIAFRDLIRRGGYASVAVGDLQVETLIASQMEKLQDDIADILATIQNELEARFEAELEAARAAAKEAPEGTVVELPALWDENGNWIDAGGELTELARQVGRDAFDATMPVKNVNHGVEFTYDEMMRLRSIEQSRAIRHITGLASRRAAEEIGMKTEQVTSLIEKRLDEIEAAWEQRGSRFVDTRETVEVPTIYLRNLKAAYRVPIENGLITLDDLPEELRSILAVSDQPASAVPSAFTDDLDTLAYFLSRARSLSDQDRALAAGADDFLIRSLPYDSEVTQRGINFTERLREYTDLLDQAQAYATSKEMLRNWAAWAALSKAQSAPLRMAYVGLSASLDVWLTATLPLRPGFVIRNVIDNTAKMLVAGARDPRFYFLGAEHPGAKVKSIFELGVNQMRWILLSAGLHQDSKAIFYFDRLMDSFWAHSSATIKKIFAAHQIDVPESWIRESQSYLADTAPTKMRAMREKVWELMAARPENYSRRALFRSEMAKLRNAGVGEREAFEQAMAKLDFTLFDYSRQSVLEDNLRFFAPFVFFWRKTAVFWSATAIQHPALPHALGNFENTFQDEHEELPSWMRRYANITPVTNALAKVPGLGWLLPGLEDGLQTDPANLFSFNVLYRSFKEQNPELPPDKQGMAFIGPFVDALNQWGISMNPLVRKPLEVAGVFNYRAWQTIFPQTGLIDAMSRRFFADRVGAGGLNLESWATDKVLALIGDDFSSTERIAQNFNQWVQLEMAAQAQRGEPVSREAAERKIQDYYAVQTVLGFFGGVYARRRDESDIFLYNLQEQLLTDQEAYANLSEKDQRAYQLFKRRKMDFNHFDQYLETLPKIEAYYSIGGDWEKLQEFKAKNPDVIPYVSPFWTHGRAFSDSFIKDAPLKADSATAIRLFTLTEKLDLDFETRRLAETVFVTPQLRAYWDRNKSPAKFQAQMLQGEYHRHLRKLNDHYFAIPESDFEAREGYLREHPELAHWWDLNNSDSDDLKSILNATNADLRDAYFEFVEADDWDGAGAFLKRFPFIFEFTKSEAKVKNGAWVGGKRGRSQHARDYLAARPFLTIFFSLLRSSKGKAYAWLQGDSEGAKIVRAYFDKYAHSRGSSAHARDYVAAKDGLNHYFKLLKEDKTKARAWLNGGSKEALVVLAYFKKYGKMAKMARRWKAVFGSKNPELDARLKFWQRYWTLEPDQRPEFVAQHAEAHGVFVYGVFGEQERQAELNAYYRKAIAHGFSKKNALYLRNKPLMDLYFTLKRPEEKNLFLRANPEVQLYLDEFANPTTGSKGLDKLLESYFSFPRRSEERSAFLQKHQQLQDYFDRNSKPADRAMHNLLEVYFSKEGNERKRFSQEHPEIDAYFQKRREERDRELLQANAFDVADPRLAALRELAERTITRPGEMMAEALRRARAVEQGGISTRRERSVQ